MSQRFCHISETYSSYYSSKKKGSLEFIIEAFVLHWLNLPFWQFFDPILIPVLILRGEEPLHWSFRLLLVVESVVRTKSEPWMRNSNNLMKLGPDPILDVASVWISQLPGVYSWSFDCGFAVKKLIFAQTMLGILPHNGMHLLQLFGVEVGVDDSTVWMELLVNYSLIIPSTCVGNANIAKPLIDPNHTS